MFLKLCISLCAWLFLCIPSSVHATQTIIVASEPTWPPMESLNENKQVVGYSIDYIKAVAQEVGLNITIQNTAWDGIFSALYSGNVDVIAASVTITADRQNKHIEFSEPYYYAHQAVTTKKGIIIHSLQDLNGKKVGGQIGTAGILESLPKVNSTAIIKTYDDIGLAFEDLKKGSIDAVICDSPVAYYYATKKSEYANSITVSFVTKESEPYGFVVKKGNKDLLTKINQGIAAIKKKNIDKDLERKWINEDQ